MRHEAAIASVSWIPYDAIAGLVRIPLDMGIGRYDDPPPEPLGDLEALRQAGRFRFANEMRCWIDVEDGEIVDAGYAGRGHICPTEVMGLNVPPVPLPDLQAEPVIEDGAAKFRQTTGGRTGAPLPRRVSGPPFVRVTAPVVWTTLELTIRADGTHDWWVAGASEMPRHWFYDGAGSLIAKSGTIDFKKWTREGGDHRSPWAEVDLPPLITKVESALERELSTKIMRQGRKPRVRKLAGGEALTKQGEPGDELYLLFDGMLDVVVDDEIVAQVGPGTVLGEGAVLGGGTRQATLRAVTPAKVVVADAADIDRDALETLAASRRPQPAGESADAG